MEMIHPLVEEYASTFTSPNNALLHEIHELTIKQHAEAHMLSSEVQGKFLSFISQIIQPKYILEIGTFVGYSALCLVDGLKRDGKLHTVEIRERDALVAMNNFKRAGKEDKIEQHIGQAEEIIPTLNYKWDLVFIDADKINYTKYYDMVFERLSDGGLIIADNVLFHGEVLNKPLKGKNAKAIQAFNEHVAGDNRAEQVLLTIRDGLLLIKKKKQ